MTTDEEGRKPRSPEEIEQVLLGIMSDPREYSGLRAMARDALNAIWAARQDSSRLRAERDEAVRERDALIRSWPRSLNDCIRYRMRDRKWFVGDIDEEPFDSREAAVRAIVFGPPSDPASEGPPP